MTSKDSPSSLPLSVTPDSAKPSSTNDVDGDVSKIDETSLPNDKSTAIIDEAMIGAASVEDSDKKNDRSNIVSDDDDDDDDDPKDEDGTDTDDGNHETVDDTDEKVVVDLPEKQPQNLVGAGKGSTAKVAGKNDGDDDDDDDLADLTSAVEQIHIAIPTDSAPTVQLSSIITPVEDLSILPESLHAAAALIRQAKNILVLSGAGVSVAAGIPDFRSPGTGLYDNLQKYNLPYPEAVFELGFYQRNPHPFLNLAKELWPSGQQYHPTWTHSFLALLAQKKRLLRNYTQNIDGLEYLANIPDDLLVECHGHFRTASCITCKHPADPQLVEQIILSHTPTKPNIPKCDRPNCSGLVKPDIVFFGESLPDRFHRLWQKDTGQADLCLILGTSLKVAPVSQLPDMVSCRRILFNRELVGTIQQRKNRRDVFHPGDCDDTVQWIAHILGWHKELQHCHLQSLRRSTGSGGGTSPKKSSKAK